MPTAKIIDLDDDLDLSEDVEEDKLESVQVKLGSWKGRVLLGLNSYSLSALTSGEPDAIAAFIDGSIHPADRESFRRFLRSRTNLTPAKLGKLCNRLVEVAGERPTKPPSASARGGNSRTSTRKSAASS